MNSVVLLLGSNMGDRFTNLEKGSDEIKMGIGEIIQQSSMYETAAWGNENQEQFLNKVVTVNSSLKAAQLMKRILSIEEKMGRIRMKKWEPRIIDIDILFYNNEMISNETLTVPHPSLHLRKFTLMPLAELMPDYIHPVLKKSITDLLHELNDSLEVKKISSF